MSFSITKNGILLLSVLAMPAHASYFDPNAYASLGSLNLADTSAPYLFDTGNNGFAPTLRDSGGNLLYTGITDSNTAIFNFSQITISSGVIINAVGTNPLALLSLGDIMLAGRLSADGQGRIGGAGGGDGGLTPFGNGVGPGAVAVRAGYRGLVTAAVLVVTAVTASAILVE